MVCCVCVRALSLPSERTVVVCVSVCVRALSLPSERTVVVCECVWCVCV